MIEKSLITDEMEKLLDVPWQPQVFKVEELGIKRYAEAIDDPNPLYNDVEYARKSKYGSLIGPPGFFGLPAIKAKILGIQVSDALIAAGAPSVAVDGGIEMEFFLPVRAGDVLLETTKIINIYERDTKSGKALFVQAEYLYKNENDDAVLRSVATTIFVEAYA
jgi:acyl dehydratase